MNPSRIYERDQACNFFRAKVIDVKFILFRLDVFARKHRVENVASWREYGFVNVKDLLLLANNLYYKTTKLYDYNWKFRKV